MGSKEILTLQFGHYANFVGTHLWNLQESGFNYTNPSCINHDVLFREGLNSKGHVTFTPRLLLVDLKGALGNCPELGNLYETPEENVSTWNGELYVQHETKQNKNAFQEYLETSKCKEKLKDLNLDKEVNVWSDFLYTRFHPRTVNVIKQYQYNSLNTDFASYPLGFNLWKIHQFQEDFADKIRNYVEECDSFQGFQFLFDANDAFSGLSGSCIQYLKDEYETKSILSIPFISPINYYDTNKDSVRILNLFLTFDHLNEFSTLFIPLSTSSKGWRQPGPPREFYHTIYNNELFYNSSAILASALDTFSLKYRIKPNNYSLVDFCKDLNPGNRKVVAASLCLPFSMNKHDDLIDSLNNWEGPLTKCLTPNCEISQDRVMQLYTIRGISENRLKNRSDKSKNQRDLPAYKCESIKEMFEFYIACNSFGSATDFTVVDKALPVTTPFPKIFDNFLDNYGNIDIPKSNRIIESIPVLSGVHNGNFISNMLKNLCDEYAKLKIGHFREFINEGYGKDEFKDCYNRLESLCESYSYNYDI